MSRAWCIATFHNATAALVGIALSGGIIGLVCSLVFWRWQWAMDSLIGRALLALSVVLWVREAAFRGPVAVWEVRDKLDLAARRRAIKDRQS